MFFSDEGPGFAPNVRPLLMTISAEHHAPFLTCISTLSKNEVSSIHINATSLLEGGTSGFSVLRYCGVFVRYFGNFAASVRYFVLSMQAVSVFIEFLTRYCGISRFSPLYCGSEYPQCPPLLHCYSHSASLSIFFLLVYQYSFYCQVLLS